MTYHGAHMTLANIGILLSMLALLAGSVMPDSPFADGLRFLGVAAVAVHALLRARAGILRRRPYWTAQSWLRYLAVCSIPIGALLTLVWMLFALERRLPIVGEAQSPERGAFVAVSVVCMLIGAGGLAIAVEWLASGEPSRQVRFSPWRHENGR